MTKLQRPYILKICVSEKHKILNFNGNKRQETTGFTYGTKTVTYSKIISQGKK